MANKATITYTWEIPQMSAHREQFGENNVIYIVRYKYTGTSSEKLPGSDTYYTANTTATESFTYVEGDPFVPYEDTEAFEDVVIGWLEDALDVDAMKVSLAAKIEKEITPVNEDLYFTWQYPPTPPVE